MRKILIVLSLSIFSFVAFATEGDFCGIEKPGTTTPCNVKGGTFSQEEIKEVVKKDSTNIEKIYKVAKEGKIYLYMFYSYDCPHCKKAHAFLDEVKKQYPELLVQQYEIKKNQDNVKVFETVAKEYNVKPQGVPTIFIGDKNLPITATTRKALGNIITPGKKDVIYLAIQGYRISRSNAFELRLPAG